MLRREAVMTLLRPQMALVSAGDRWPHVATSSKRGSGVEWGGEEEVVERRMKEKGSDKDDLHSRCIS